VDLAEKITAVTGGVVWALGLINALTRHWSSIAPGPWYTRVVRAALWILERASYLSSANADPPQALKWPLTSRRPLIVWDESPTPIERPRSGGAGRAALLMLMMSSVIPITSCTPSWRVAARATLDGIHAAARVAQMTTEETYRAKCETAAKRCADEHDAACLALVDCQRSRREVLTSLGAVYSAIGAAVVAVEATPDDQRQRALDAVERAAHLAQTVSQLIAGRTP
jgi:hypothetical protein